ncbi:MAG: CotH kinase family protein [Chitinophagaceae bacterium]|nr:CotH kinase family protein [Chitinophagaceae bacterium]
MKKILLFIPSLFLFTLIQAQLSSSNLPLIVINTNGQDIQDDPKIMADMGIIFNGNNARNNITDSFNHYNGKIGIEIRGQSSQMFPMKSYSIELWNSTGGSVNKSLFGLPSESDWVLYAPYSDKTLLHNFLAYTLSREFGHWAANCRYVEVVVNGAYKGIYVFMEKIKRKAGRVNVPSMSNTDNSGDAVTGGYIFSIDKEADGWFSRYPAGGGSIQYSYIYPKVTNITLEQKAYIKAYTDSFEDALHHINYQDKQNGWRKFADENSFIDYFIVNEASRNVDGYRLSSFFYKDRYSKNGKINAGPVWDYDLAFRNADYCNGSNVDGWAYQFNTVCPGDFWQVPFWWGQLLADTSFKNNLRCRWKALRTTALHPGHLNHVIDSVASLTAEARQRHFQQWPTLGQYVWPNPQPIATTYEGEIQTLKTWLASRLDWIDKNIPNTGACTDYPSNLTASFNITSFSNPLNNNDMVIQSRQEQNIGMKVMDMTGRLLQWSSVHLAAGSNTIQLPSAYWAAGIYFIELSNAAGEKVTKRIVK